MAKKVLHSQKTEFLWRKKGFKFMSKYEIQIFAKNVTFSFGFSIVVQPNQGIQLKGDCFEQLAKYANDPYHF